MIRVLLGFFSYGGIEPMVFDCLLRELKTSAKRGVRFTYLRCSQDALVSRSRSWLASVFLERTSCDVLFMLDHDVEFVEGDIAETCLRAYAERAVIGGMYACRGRAEGHSSYLEGRVDPGAFRPGEDKMYPARYVAGGFTAIPRSVVAGVMERLGKPDVASDLRVRRTVYEPHSLWDFFRPITVDTERGPVYLSEDWSFSERVRAAGLRQFVWSKPRLLHHGDFPYSVADGVRGRGVSAELIEVPVVA